MTVTDEVIEELLKWARRDALTSYNGDLVGQLADALVALQAERTELHAAQHRSRDSLDAAEKRLAALRSALEKIATKNLDFHHVARVALDKDEVHP